MLGARVALLASETPWATACVAIVRTCRVHASGGERKAVLGFGGAKMGERRETRETCGLPLYKCMEDEKEIQGSLNVGT